MASDAGVGVWTFPSAGTATDAGQCVVGNCTPGGVKANFLCDQNYNLFEVGAMIGTATAADTYVFTVSTAPLIGGVYVLRTTVTGPAAAAIPAGTCLKSQPLNVFMPKGTVLQFNVTDATAAGTAMFYAVVSPAGDPAVHLMGATNILPETVSTT